MPEAQYTYVLELWHLAATRQLEALEASDWPAFEAALAYKRRLLEAWGREGADLPALYEAASETTRRGWEALLREIEALDAEIDAIIRRLMDEVKAEMRQFSEGQSALRRYVSLPREFTPSYHDKKY